MKINVNIVDWKCTVLRPKKGLETLFFRTFLSLPKDEIKRCIREQRNVVDIYKVYEISASCILTDPGPAIWPVLWKASFRFDYTTVCEELKTPASHALKSCAWLHVQSCKKNTLWWQVTRYVLFVREWGKPSSILSTHCVPRIVLWWQSKNTNLVLFRRVELR